MHITRTSDNVMPIDNYFTVDSWLAAIIDLWMQRKWGRPRRPSWPLPSLVVADQVFPSPSHVLAGPTSYEKGPSLQTAKKHKR